MILNDFPVIVESYRKNSNAFLELDAQFTVMEAALKGYIRWVDCLNNSSTAQPNVSLSQFTPVGIFYQADLSRTV